MRLQETLNEMINKHYLFIANKPIHIRRYMYSLCTQIKKNDVDAVMGENKRYDNGDVSMLGPNFEMIYHSRLLSPQPPVPHAGASAWETTCTFLAILRLMIVRSEPKISLST